MINPRLDFYAVHYNSTIYVFGGKNQYGPMRSCERYDISQNKWTMLPSLPEATSNMAGVLTVDDGESSKLIKKPKLNLELVILSGGYTKYEASRMVYQFDFKYQKYVQMPKMMFHRAEHIMDIVTINDESSLITVGGSDHPYNGRVVWNIEILTNDGWRIYDRIHPTGPFAKGELYDTKNKN